MNMDYEELKRTAGLTNYEVAEILDMAGDDDFYEIFHGLWDLHKEDWCQKELYSTGDFVIDFTNWLRAVLTEIENGGEE